MLLVFIGILGGFAFVFLTRLFWTEQQRIGSRRPLVTLAVLVLLGALLLLTVTGRLHWLSAAVAAIVPFLRRAVGLLRFAPIVGKLFGARAAAGGQRQRGQSRPPPASGGLSVLQAREVLNVPGNATRAEIVKAHRRLMQRNHPDQGGSNFLAAQINEAKEVLLRNSPS